MVIETRAYGRAGGYVLVLHGGPGAAGYMRPVAVELAGSFRVLEPFQRGSGGERLTVERHVADLDEVVKSYCREERPGIVGHSWGAMLALAYAATHPEGVGSVVLVGCGTFDQAARQRMEAVRKERMDEKMLRRLERLAEEYPDRDKRLEVLGRLMQQMDSYELVRGEGEVERCDEQAHKETWQDMMRLQEQGVYPAAFAKIGAPVLMLHGAADPHPGELIRANLQRYVRQLEYYEWDRCGHYPWLEKAVRDDFYTVLREWLGRQGEKR